MKSSQECRNLAEECRALASRSSDALMVAEFLNLADTWDSLAESRENSPPGYRLQPLVSIGPKELERAGNDPRGRVLER
jgi:hypothetical protein